MGQFLGRHGFIADGAHNGPDSLRAALSGAYELVVLDVMMPGFDGFEVLKQLRRRSRIPVLMLTARTESQSRIHSASNPGIIPNMKRSLPFLAALLIGLALTLSAQVLSPRSGVRVQQLVWLGDSIRYPDPSPDEDPATLGDTYKIWFAGVGPAKRGDTFPMTWADDDHIYASSGDPHWGRKATGLDVERFSGLPPDYYIRKVNEMEDFVGNGGEGPKPTGMICLDGVLYLAFQNLLGKKPPVHGTKSQHGSDAAIVASRDHGQSWHPGVKDLKEPMFSGPLFGGPAFINFGKNNEGARDGYVYAVSADQWDNGSHLRLGRVPKDRIQDASAWEWVRSISRTGEPSWARKLEDSTPVLSRERKISLPDMVYIRSVRRYLLLTWSLNKDFSPEDGSELFVYEALEPWGPFSLVHHELQWEDRETTPYCPRLPLKWLRESEKGITGWLQFSGSWRQNSKHYRSHIRPFRLVVK
jgi:CheY-like chemotaxis protein